MHLSDLHFGHVDHATLQPLADAVVQIHPDLLTVSGDLTQRARIAQFKQARAFLDSLPSPQIVVPGNHDLPLDNPFLRISRPLARFQRYVSRDLSPSYIDDEIAVLGLNTTRRMLATNGRLNAAQMRIMEKHFAVVPNRSIKVVVTHHPFDLPKGLGEHQLVGRSRMAMEAFAKSRVDVFLSGHLHLTRTGSTARYEIAGYETLVIQAGTATSTRRRGETNSFNVLRIEEHELRVETHAWQEKHHIFKLAQSRSFRRTAPESISGPEVIWKGWQEIPS